jgi:MFS family permease
MISLVSRLALPRVEGVRSNVLWLVLMSVALAVMLLPFSSYVAALPLIKTEWGLNNTQAGVIYSAFLVGYAFSALVVIPLTDRLGPKPVLLAAAALSVASHALFPLLADGIVSASVLRTIQGIGLVGVYMPAVRIISDRFAAKGRGAAIGLFVAAGYGGHSLSLVATGGLMALVSWRDAYLIVALIAAASLPLAYTLLRGQRHAVQGRPSGRLDVRVLKQRPVRYMVAGYTLHSLEIFTVQAWLPSFLAAVLVMRGSAAEDAAVVAAAAAGLAFAIGSIGPLIGGALSDRWGRAGTAVLIFAMSSGCAWAIGWMGGLPWPLIVFVAVVYGVATSADSAIYSAGLVDAAAPATLGSSMAVQAFVGFVGGVAGPIIVGGILDLVPEDIAWGIGFSFLGILALVATALFVRLHATAKKTSVAPLAASQVE